MEPTPVMSNESKNVPTLRFPMFQGEWEHKKLNEFLSEAKKRNTRLTYGKEDVLSVSGEFGIVNQIEHLGRSYAGASVHNYHVVETGSIVYTKSPLKANPYGIIKINKGKAGIVSTLYAVYTANEEKAMGLFFDYYFALDANVNRYLRPLVKKGAKNDMKINNAYVLNDKVFVPTIAEQKKITEFLSSIEDKIHHLIKKRALLKSYMEGLIQQIFSRRLRFKDANGQSFSAWEQKNLGDVLSFHVTNSFSRSLLNYEVGTVKNIHYGDIHTKFKSNFILDQEVVPYINEEVDLSKIPLSSYCKVGDLIIADASEDYKDIGKSIEIVNLNNETVLAGLHTIIASDKNRSFALGFKGYLMQSRKVRLQIMTMATGVSVLGISKGNIARIEIELPSIAEQVKIADFLTAIDSKITLVTKLLHQTQQFKKGLLQQLFV